MVEESQLKYWRDAGHVARRTLEAMKLELQPGKTFHEIIESAERYIHRHGGKPAFPGTIAVNDLAAHFTTNHQIEGVEGWDGEMVLQKGDLVKIDFGVHIKGHIGDNALTFEVGNSNQHTEQIKAAKEARDAAVEMLHPGTPWYKVGQAAAQPSLDAGFQPIRNLCGHQLKPWELHAGVSVPSYACGKENQGFRGVVEEGGVYAIEPFNTTGSSGLIENIGTPPFLQHLSRHRTDHLAKSEGEESTQASWRTNGTKSRGTLLHASLCRAMGLPHAEETLPRCRRGEFAKQVERSREETHQHSIPRNIPCASLPRWREHRTI